MIFMCNSAYAQVVPPVPIRAGLYVEKPCPANAIVILAMGQSNSANHIEGALTEDSSKAAYMALNGKCYTISDPVLGGTGRGASLWPRVARWLSVEAAQPVIIIGAGAGSYGVQDWAFNVNGQMTYARNQAAQMRAIGQCVDFVIWHQGETDNMNNMLGATYAYRLNAIFNALVTDNNPCQPVKFLVHLASRCTSYPIDDEVRLGQQSVIDTRSDTFLASDTDLLDNTFRKDTCHFNETGNATVSRSLVDAIKAHL
jgi:Carbohydrate esterase, sialic acid-specific acetylesterase